MKNKHICEFKPVYNLEITFLDPGIYSFERGITAIELFFKGQKKAKRAKRCKICGKYAIECPYCKKKIETFDYPLKMVCPHCNKEFQVRWD